MSNQTLTIIEIACLSPAILFAIAFGTWPIVAIIHQRFEFGKWYPNGSEK